MGTVHLESNVEDISNIVIMPGDPLRAKYIADKYLKDVKLVNQIRNNWGFTGYYKEKKVSIIASGMGMSSMSIYAYELFNDYHVEHIIRVGTSGAYDECLNLQDLVLATSAYSEANIAKKFNNDNLSVTKSSEYLNEIIEKVALEQKINLYKGTVHTNQLFYTVAKKNMKKIKKNNCLVIEMEAFILFHIANHFKKNATAILTVTDFIDKKEQMSAIEREKSLDKMILLTLESIIKL